MAAVGEPAGEDPLVEGRRDLIADDHPAQRHVARVRTLGEDDQVGVDAPVVDGQPFAGAPEARHHLIGDVHDPVFVAQRPNSIEIARRRHQDAGGSDHGFDEHRGDRVRALECDDLLEVGQCAFRFLLLVGRPERRTVQVRPEEVHVSVGELVGPATRVAGGVDGGAGVAVIAAVEAQDLVFAGVQTGHADRVLRSIGAAVGEEHLVVARWGDFTDRLGGAAAHQRCVLRCQGGLDRGLLLDGRHHGGVLVADVEVDQLAGEVEERVAFEVPQTTARAGLEHQGFEGALRAPRVEDVGAVEVERFGVARHVVRNDGIRIGHADQGTVCSVVWGSVLRKQHERRPGEVLSGHASRS